MADRNITLIKDLDNMKDDYTLKVSIIRLWRSLSDVNPIIFKSIEMILMDEMCTKIRASVYPRDFQRFESKLKEDQAVYIRSPTIPPNRYSFKISDVTSKLNLNGRTTVNECLHIQSKTTYGFSCVSFERIISATTTSNDSIDVIGEIVSLGKLDSRDVNVTLFGDIAYQLISYLEAHKQVGRMIVLLHLVGLRGLQNSSSSLTVDSSQSYSEYDDFLNNHNVKNVVDLPEPQEEGKFIIVGTIYGIRQDTDWYYDACTNYEKKVDARNVFSGSESSDASVVYECYTDKCIKKEISSVPRYKIPIRVHINKY
ncbi:unnamed protein product [Lactuca virosa]|uniref:Replication protein A 70 kDa DNA-binding subunit B/D first OB fold domain-containing protein n=1 Tax=Lactuca virosa TaxID=75947 RepID=A0AAU9MZE2_9ASTR|nr:unnamed protein product [Lactuca virosa]